MGNNSNNLNGHPHHNFVRDAVIVKSPYRISLGGGGTDLPFYFQERGGLLISASINQYMTVSAAARILDDQFFIQTTYTQVAEKLDELTHDIIREALRYFDVQKGFQIATYSTLPTTTGLGASSTLMVGLVSALNLIKGNVFSPWEVAKEAHRLERDILGLAGGIQDQYIAALGGVKVLEVDTSGKVSARELNIPEHNRHELERGLVLVYTGEVRDSPLIIKSQQTDKNKMLENYDKIKEIGVESVKYLMAGDVLSLGEAMNRHWEIKKQLSDTISNNYLDDTYVRLKNIGSSGGKIIGAGGGGFFMMAVPGSVDLYLREVSRLGYRFLDWRFEFSGAHMIDSSP